MIDQYSERRQWKSGNYQHVQGAQQHADQADRPHHQKNQRGNLVKAQIEMALKPIHRRQQEMAGDSEGRDPQHALRRARLSGVQCQ